MKKWLYRLIALCIAVVLLFTGCSPTGWDALLRQLQAVPFSEMVYTRPDVDGLLRAKAEVNAQLDAGSDVETLMDSIYAFYDSYYDFATNYALANIYYSKDLRDIYWEQEYNYCLDVGSQADAALDSLLHDLAGSSHREALEAEEYFGADFFDDYQGESLWNETFTALMDQEAQLQSEYYALSAEAVSVTPYSEDFYNGCGAKMAELFVEMIALRQEIAKTAGYEDYLSFAYDFYYGRDYSPQQVQVLFDGIAQNLVPVYRNLASSDVWYIGTKPSTEKETFSYVKNAAKAMGGVVEEAFSFMEKNDLYDITYSENKYDASFEVYLLNYSQPYVFLNPTGSMNDRLTFVHEFGHFCNDYASYGSVVGIDVAEVFSQGMEYLSLCYVDDPQLEQLKMADSLGVYVEQAAYASFEHRAYSLEGENLTTEAVYALFDEVGEEYGLDIWQWDGRSFVYIPHFFTNPLYIVSYVVSNDAALQIYQQEKAQKGAGLSLLEENLTTEQADFLAFVQEAGLEDPFAEGRLETVRKTFEKILG